MCDGLIWWREKLQLRKIVQLRKAQMIPKFLHLSDLHKTAGKHSDCSYSSNLPITQWLPLCRNHKWAASCCQEKEEDDVQTEQKGSWREANQKVDDVQPITTVDTSDGHWLSSGTGTRQVTAALSSLLNFLETLTTACSVFFALTHRHSRVCSCLVLFSSVSWPIGSSGGHEGRFSRNLLPVLSAGGHCE